MLVRFVEVIKSLFSSHHEYQIYIVITKDLFITSHSLVECFASYFLFALNIPLFINRPFRFVEEFDDDHVESSSFR